jgi:hypothetical protein
VFSIVTAFFILADPLQYQVRKESQITDYQSNFILRLLKDETCIPVPRLADPA